MSNDAFDLKALGEKLSKLNNSQQSIESVSRWCINHRDKARKITETWEKLFNTLQNEQRISFLFLANDILQNSRRIGNEFVTEFWKVLPSTLKQAHDNGDVQLRATVVRLVEIWEQRKVFGSRGPGLKYELLGKSPLSPLPTNGKSSNAVKIIKKDTQSVRIKLAVGSLPEKIMSAFQSVIDEEPNEEKEISKLNSAIVHAEKLRIEAESNPHTAIMHELDYEERHLLKCIEKVEASEATRNQLILELQEAIKFQETKISSMQSQLHNARAHIDKISNLRKRTASGAFISEEESKKAAAAAVAAKLTASTSSVQMLSSVLSSFMADEAASFDAFPAEKRQKMEKPMVAQPASYSAPSQYVSVGMMGYGYGGNVPPPPHIGAMGMGRVGGPPQPAVVPPQQKAGGGFFRPPGIGFYGQAPPPVPRQ